METLRKTAAGMETRPTFAAVGKAPTLAAVGKAPILAAGRIGRANERGAAGVVTRGTSPHSGRNQPLGRPVPSVAQQQPLRRLQVGVAPLTEILHSPRHVDIGP